MGQAVKPPRKVKVGGYTFTVEPDGGLSAFHSVNGVCGPDTQQVLYDPQVGFVVLRDTILHELMHGITNQLAFCEKQVGLSDDQEEHVVRTLSTAILALLRDNPKLVQFLTEKEV
jgi:hypothetical protein